ncbi:Protein of uncharacterised function (DUF328) [uncultured Roseburia sp.]|uniref:UPF0246 protein OCV88_08290 n=1 Tax=Brotonthovivens ammoniilytica TaxID=2981725 RepID=A0ABT2TLA9_9FIRM|nr:peroxide stress protein YaaA [Brotonthovivens ammoniilytica]MCU6762329.1 peroxide stress protein YaaA [Brotonthovivens ammoniilytica]SCI68184.1 Protein of uncharacterised function (DUF328) [uncultured Roseburia sp.]
MKIIISPAKKMNTDTDTLAVEGLPVYLHRTKKILSYLQGLSRQQAKELWKCNDKLTDLNYQRIQQMELARALTPAVLSYEGIQYQYMAPGVLDEDSLQYLQDHLRILSGFYGILNPFDGVVPYRLEMQAKAGVDGCRDLYEFWGSSLYESLAKETDCILNLASKEYSRCIEKYLEPEIMFITVVFGQMKEGKVIQKGTLAKMARGEMVRYMAENGIEDLERVKGFDRLNFIYAPERSDEKIIVFLQK